MPFYNLIELFQDLDYLNIIFFFYSFFYQNLLDSLYNCISLIFNLLVIIVHFNDFKYNMFSFCTHVPGVIVYSADVFYSFAAFYIFMNMKYYYMLTNVLSQFLLVDYVNFAELLNVCDFVMDVLYSYIYKISFFSNFAMSSSLFLVWFQITLTVLSICGLSYIVKINNNLIKYYVNIIWSYLSVLMLIINYLLKEGMQYIKTWVSLIVLLWILMVCLIIFAFSNIFGLVPFGWSLTINFFGLSFMIWVVLSTILILNGFYVNTFKLMALFFPKDSPSLLAPIVVGLEMMSYVIWAIAMPIWMFANSFAGHVLLSLGIIIGLTPTSMSLNWLDFTNVALNLISGYLGSTLNFLLLVDYLKILSNFSMLNVLIWLNFLYTYASFILTHKMMILILCFNSILKFIIIVMVMPFMMLSLELIVSFMQSYIGFVLLLLYIRDNESVWGVSWLSKYTCNLLYVSSLLNAQSGGSSMKLN